MDRCGVLFKWEEVQVNTESNTNEKKVAHAKTKKKPHIEPSHYARMVNEAAYYRAERRGFLPGYDLLDWLEAEAEINNHLESGLF